MKGLRHWLNDPPFVNYIGLGPFLVVWGNGLELDIGRLYFRLRVRAGRRPKTRSVSSPASNLGTSPAEESGRTEADPASRQDS